MSRTPFADHKIRDEVCGRLQHYFDHHKTINKAAFARQLGISRASLYKYIHGVSTPSPELLAKFLDVPEISLTLAERPITSQEPRTVQEPEQAEAQYPLPFDVPVYIANEAQNITLGIIRKSPGSAESLQFTIQIKLPRSGS